MECEWENMAKYDVTFLCGHTETVELVGYEKERKKKKTLEHVPHKIMPELLQKEGSRRTVICLP